MHQILFKKLIPTAIIPTFGHSDNRNAGLDFYSCNRIIIFPHESSIVNTGVAWEFVSGFDAFSPFPNDKQWWKAYLQIKGRSGLSFNYGIEVSNAGVIDESYRGPIMIKLYNNSDNEFIVEKGMKIAQGICILLPMVNIKEVDTLSETERGEKGFGSSGK